MEENNKTTTVRLNRDLHRKLKTLYPLRGYDNLQDYIHEGLVNWVKFEKEQLRSKKED